MLRRLKNCNCLLSIKIISVVYLLAILMPNVAKANQPAGSAQPLRIVFNNDGVNVIERPGDRDITLRITMDGKTFELTTPYGYDRVNTIRKFNNFLAVSAVSYEIIKGFFIIDLSRKNFIDEVWGRNISISPSGQYVAFTEFYPNHGSQPENKYLIYDLSLSPLANREIGGPLVRKRLEEQNIFNSPEMLYKFFAGAPLITVENELLLRNSLNLTESEEHRLKSALSWAPESDELAFLEAHRNDFRVILVRVGGSKVINSVLAHKLELSKRERNLFEYKAEQPDSLQWTDRGWRVRAWSGNDVRGSAQFDRIIDAQQFFVVPQPF
jgi:hypothetical protein